MMEIFISLIVGAIAGLGIGIYNIITEKKREAQRERWRQAGKLETEQENKKTPTAAIAKLIEAKKLGERYDMPGKYIGQLTAMVAYLSGNSVKRETALREIQQLRAEMSFDGFVDYDIDECLVEAEGALRA